MSTTAHCCNRKQVVPKRTDLPHNRYDQHPTQTRNQLNLDHEHRSLVSAHIGCAGLLPLSMTAAVHGTETNYTELLSGGSMKRLQRNKNSRHAHTGAWEHAGAASTCLCSIQKCCIHQEHHQPSDNCIAISTLAHMSAPCCTGQHQVHYACAFNR